MNIILICAAGIAGTAAAVLAGEHKKEYGMLTACAAGILIMAAAITGAAPAVAWLRSLGEGSALPENFSVILKSLGFALITHVSAELCRDAGHSSIASKVEFAGKIAIVAACLPIFKDIVGMGMQMLYG